MSKIETLDRSEILGISRFSNLILCICLCGCVSLCVSACQDPKTMPATAKKILQVTQWL